MTERSAASPRAGRGDGDDSMPMVLITGAAGMIGTRTAQRLSRSYTVIGLDVQEPPSSFPSDARFIECDLTSDQSTHEAIAAVYQMTGGRLASVIHLAAYYDFSGEPSPLYDELTVEGTGRLLRALQVFEVEQFVFSSSLLVMQPADGGDRLTEESPVHAEWDYPRSKLDAEERILQERGHIPCVILRLAGIYDEDGHSPPITQQIWRIRERKLESFFFPGNRSHGQAFVHLDDAVESIRCAVEARRELSPHEVFLIGEPEVMSYEALQDAIGEGIYGREWHTIRIPAALAKLGAWMKQNTPLGSEDPFIKPWMIDLADAHYPVSIERARERIRWEPRHRLRDTLPRMIQMLERDPLAWYRENDLPIDSDSAEPRGPHAHADPEDASPRQRSGSGSREARSDG